jgi:hypothetical protein
MSVPMKAQDMFKNRLRKIIGVATRFCFLSENVQKLRGNPPTERHERTKRLKRGRLLRSLCVV